MKTYVLQDDDGQTAQVHSVSAGLDYPGVGPEHAWLKDHGRVKYFSATDREALDAFLALSRLEGIIPALEPAHALAHLMRMASGRAKNEIIVLALSGRFLAVDDDGAFADADTPEDYERLRERL